MADVLHLARVTIEAVSPLSSASGETGLFDMALSRDASGLPQIAAASLQGVLRHLHEETFEQPKRSTRWLFGYGESDVAGKTLDKGENPKGAAGRLFFGYGKVHDAKDQAVTGIRYDAPDFDQPDDPLLRMLAAEAPIGRDHVALNHAHVVAGRAKFDRVAVPKGTRFSFEIAMWGEEDAEQQDRTALLEVLSLMKHPGFRIGGAARRGYGCVEVERAGHVALPLADPDRIRTLRQAPPSCLKGFTEFTGELKEPAKSGAVTVKLTLTPIGLWRVGSTGQPVRTDQRDLHHSGGYVVAGREPDPRAKDVDAAPAREPWIDWSTGEGKWQPEADAGAPPIVVPGSAIKGPLAHRTLFHWNRLENNLLDAESPTAEEDLKRWQVRSEKLESLFGLAKEKQDEQQRSRGQAARLIVDDAEVKIGDDQIAALDHNSIDRFTGGVRSRILFSEEAAYGGSISTTITILKPLDGGWDDKVREAFCIAVRDLVEGRLALGAKSLGFCTGGEPKFGGDPQEREGWNAAYAKAVNETARAAGESGQQ